MDRGLKRRLPEISLLAGALCFSLLLVEIILRVWNPSPYVGISTTAPQDTFFQYDPVLGWKGVPHVSGPFHGVDFSSFVRLDGNGFRNANPPFVGGRSNVLVLGDSYGWGWGVENSEMFHARIMEKDDRFNVYNLSAPGYGTDQEYLTLEGWLRDHDQLRFDGVVLLFYLNDFDDALDDVRYGYAKPAFVLSGDGRPLLVNVPVPRLSPGRVVPAGALKDLKPASWLNRFHTFNFLACKVPILWDRLTQGDAPGVTGENGVRPTADEESSLQIAFALLKLISDLVKHNDMSFHVVILMTRNVDPDAWQWAHLDRFLVSQGISHSSFRSTGFPSTDLWLDGHLSPRGHLKLADHVLAMLTAESASGSRRP